MYVLKMYLITLPNSSSGEHKYLMYSCIVMMRLVSTLWTCLNYNTLTHNRFHPSVDLRKKKYRKIESLRRWFREIKNIKRKWKVHHTTNLCLFLMIYVETDTSSTEHHWASQTPLNTRGGGFQLPRTQWWHPSRYSYYKLCDNHWTSLWLWSTGTN
jgi:hypothetical protein